MSPHRRPTLRDVAATAGVSHQTVSRVLNTPTEVAPATRERVLAAITALDYSPNAAARSLGRLNPGFPSPNRDALPTPADAGHVETASKEPLEP